MKATVLCSRMGHHIIRVRNGFGSVRSLLPRRLALETPIAAFIKFVPVSPHN